MRPRLEGVLLLAPLELLAALALLGSCWGRVAAGVSTRTTWPAYTPRCLGARPRTSLAVEPWQAHCLTFRVGQCNIYTGYKYGGFALSYAVYTGCLHGSGQPYSLWVECWGEGMLRGRKRACCMLTDTSRETGNAFLGAHLLSQFDAIPAAPHLKRLTSGASRPPGSQVSALGAGCPGPEQTPDRANNARTRAPELPEPLAAPSRSPLTTKNPTYTHTRPTMQTGHTNSKSPCIRTCGPKQC